MTVTPDAFTNHVPAAKHYDVLAESDENLAAQLLHEFLVVAEVLNGAEVPQAATLSKRVEWLAGAYRLALQAEGLL